MRCDVFGAAGGKRSGDEMAGERVGGKKLHLVSGITAREMHEVSASRYGGEEGRKGWVSCKNNFGHVIAF